MNHIEPGDLTMPQILAVFDAWLEETLEAVRENEMRGRRDGSVGYHTYDLL